MKHIIFGLGLVLLLCIGFVNRAGAQQNDLPLLKGAYLGQKPPGSIPEVFAPGFISTDKSELNSVFSSDGKEFYYSIYTPEPVGKYTIWHTRMIDGVWTKPEIPSFGSEHTDVDMSFSPDGKRIYFCSRRPVPGNPKPEYYIWYSNRLKDHSWSEPVLMDFPVNTPFSETYPTFTKNGRMYVASNRTGSIGSKDVYSIDYVDGKYTNAVNLGDSINTEYGEGDTFISPDESYMIIACWGRPEGKGMDISFKKEADLDIEAHSRFGQVMVKGPIEQKEQANNYFRGRAGNGKTLVRLTTFNGNIDVNLKD